MKKRYWAFVLYPESAPENWKEILQQTGLSCCVSPLHDKDINPTGEPKKAHYHIILCYSGPTTDTHGLTAIITAPLSLISSITSKSCSPLVVPLPYVDKDLTLPCMGTIYSNHFGSFLSIYQMITFGIVAYWVCVRIFNLVKDFKNPDHDEIEVLDL